MAAGVVDLSDEDKQFLAELEEEFKDRYTEKDEEFMKVFNANPSTPPIVDPWFVYNNNRRFDRRRFNPSSRPDNNDRHPYDRRGNRARYPDNHNHYNKGHGSRSYNDRGYQNRWQ